MNTSVIYNFINAVESSSEDDIELFKHILCNLLSEVNLTDEQLQILQDRADLIELDREIKAQLN